MADRPSQFAAQRTDAKLNCIGDPVVWYCSPADDVLPHPMACLITGITPQEARRKGVAEVVFAQNILNEMMQPGTCSVGYNSIRFDDTVTIERPGAKAGAVALTKLPNGHFLVAAWSDSDSGKRRFDFYLSVSDDFLDGFGPVPVTYVANTRPFKKYQTINFLVQEPGPPHGAVRLFIAGLRHDGIVAPWLLNG
ncbi:MAG: hypothetical protein IIB78_11545, partial [Proteobacteria bacterium]|nr:hypothetical protein [Pseudomonadota bacterium]